MRIMIAAATAVILCGQAGPAHAVPFQIDLLEDQLVNQPGMDSWTWDLALPGPIVAPANGTVQLDFSFDGGFLRLRDLGSPPDLAQRRYRDGLLHRLASQQSSLTALETEIAGIDDQIASKQSARTGFAAQFQQSQADLTEVQSTLQVIQQTTETLQSQLNAIKAALVSAEAKLQDAIEAVGDFIGDILGDAYQALVDARNDALDAVSNLLQQKSQVDGQLTQAHTDAQVKQAEQIALIAKTTALENQLGILDGDIARLETQKNDAEARRSALTTMISVTAMELAQLPEGETAEGLLLKVDGPSGEPVALFGQLSLDVAAGNAAWSAPFFQGVFEGGSLQSLIYADITPSFVDLEGFTLVLDLFGQPGQPFVLDRLTFELQADEVDIVSGAGVTPVPAPPTLAMLACGLLGLGWFRRRVHGEGDDASAVSSS